MAEYRVKKNNIIYIIPDDELFLKLKNGEAYIDDYGRLINRKPHRVLRELKHYAENPPVVKQRTVAPPAAPVKRSSQVKEHLKDTARDAAMEVGGVLIDWAFDKFFYEVVPNVWQEHIVPFFHRPKAPSASEELKVDAISARGRTSVPAAAKPITTRMTKEEADAEKRKVLYHWISMLCSLKKLQDAGEMDIDSTLARLTDAVVLERVNALLSENPNLLETDKYIVLHGLLGRDLYDGRQLIPIRAAEITTIAESYRYDARNNVTEE